MWSVDPQVSLIRMLIHDNSRSAPVFSDALLRAAIGIDRSGPPLPAYVLLAAREAWRQYPSDVSGGPWFQRLAPVAGPLVNFTSPINNHTYAIGSNVNVVYSATPNIFSVHGVYSLTGSIVATGHTVALTTAGTFTITVTAWNKSGGKTVVVHTFTVA